jgi:hypothetical protein
MAMHKAILPAIFGVAVLWAMNLPAGEGANQYVGAEKCKNCHNAASKGDPYGVWMKSLHFKAYETLAGDKAKGIAKDKGIADPQKDKNCVMCHVTAYEVPAAQKGKKFDQTQGVQCETCHGPGGNHVKARLDAEEEAGDKVVQLPKGEIVHVPAAETCKQCHNEKSPTYKPFDFAGFAKKIAHLDPRRNHPADYLDKLGAEAGK